MVIYHKIQQNTDAWFELRMRKFTASTGKKLFMGKKTKGYTEAINLLVYEILTDENPDDFKGSAYMKRGKELEPEAIKAYENKKFTKVLPGGFVQSGDWTGVSPDGIIGEDGLLEAKAPAWNTMVEYLRAGKLPDEYDVQIQFQLFVSGRKWVDFIAYHPKLGSLILRVVPNPETQAKIANELGIAIAEVKSRVNTILLQKGKPTKY